jgi:hypothetical protein
MIKGVVIISSYAASLKNDVMLLVFWTMGLMQALDCIRQVMGSMRGPAHQNISFSSNNRATIEESR